MEDAGMFAARAMAKLREGGNGALDGTDPSRLHAAADEVAAIHHAAPRVEGKDFLGNLLPASGRPSQAQEVARNREHLARRARAGRVRSLTHGNEDVLFDLSRLLAPLIAEGHPLAANLLANRYADVSPQGATGWAQLPLFLSLHCEPGLADALLAAASPRLVVIGGLSGAGKSTLARMLGHRLGRGAGARVIRSDVFRKRLAGLLPERRLPPAHYTPMNDQETYAAMFESAHDHLACGSSVVLEGVFMSRSERDVAESLAERNRVAFTGLWLEAPERDRLLRVAARTSDASDANEAVVRLQSRRSTGEIHWHRIRTNRPLERIVAAARGAMDRNQ